MKHHVASHNDVAAADPESQRRSLLLTGWEAIMGSAALALAALFALGLTTSLFNGRSALFSGARQAIIGAAAAAVTFAAGHLFDALHGPAF